MKKYIVKAISVGVLLMIIFAPAAANARVDVIVNVPLPPLVIPAPPGLVVIPGTGVYYPPDVDVDIFFYHGYWYRPYNGYWYRSRGYNGPWATIEVGRVPRPVIGIHPGFRGGPMYERVPHGRVMKNWRRWERDRYWERRGPERRGPEGRGHEGKGHER
ncbi:MAG TPA: hypothetical protein VMT12_12055 [Syntrophales bacterium]|nr:hypothetical protein [Syntrophales bacterium]